MGRQSLKRIVPPAVAVLIGSVAGADDIPPYMRNVVAPLPMTSPKAVAVRDALALDDQMQVIYSNSLQLYKKNLLARSPVILGLFSNQGGEFYLYRPGKPMVQAPRVPVTYEICKSCGHSAMADFFASSERSIPSKPPSAASCNARYCVMGVRHDGSSGLARYGAVS